MTDIQIFIVVFLIAAFCFKIVDMLVDLLISVIKLKILEKKKEIQHKQYIDFMSKESKKSKPFNHGNPWKKQKGLATMKYYNGCLTEDEIKEDYKDEN